MARIAIVSAMREEMAALEPLCYNALTSEYMGSREFHFGRLGSHDVILTLSGIGKVAAATTAAILCDRFAVSALLFTGVAGGLAPQVVIGDVVLAHELLQHDMNASPLFPRWQVPLTGKSRFAADRAWNQRLALAAQRVLLDPHNPLRQAQVQQFGIESPKLHQGLIISGDRFVCTGAESLALRADLPDALAVEMEGAAVAQVCADFGRPFAVLRTISDRADDQATHDFSAFVQEVARVATREIVMAALQDAF